MLKLKFYKYYPTSKTTSRPPYCFLDPSLLRVFCVAKSEKKVEAVFISNLFAVTTAGKFHSLLVFII
jgi:hypothetical protein